MRSGSSSSTAKYLDCRELPGWGGHQTAMNQLLDEMLRLRAKEKLTRYDPEKAEEAALGETLEDVVDLGCLHEGAVVWVTGHKRCKNCGEILNP